MTINAPAPEQIPQLRRLWQQAFGDTDEFLEDFFCVAFSEERCATTEEDGKIAAMLYWFDCAWEGKKVAYIYAVATDEAYRNRGLCRALMESTHEKLQSLGYAGAVLVPGSLSLFSLYKKLGYTEAGIVPCTFNGLEGVELVCLEKKL